MNMSMRVFRVLCAGLTAEAASRYSCSRRPATNEACVPSELTDGHNHPATSMTACGAEAPGPGPAGGKAGRRPRSPACSSRSSTELLLAPFVAEAQDEGSIFTNAMSMRQV